jgi:hypothetical protein
VREQGRARGPERGPWWGRLLGRLLWAQPSEQCIFELNRILSKGLELIQLKMSFQCSNKFQIKYGCEGFQQRNNFLHRNFFIFKMDFELKFGESQSVFEFSNLIKIVRNGPKI